MFRPMTRFALALALAGAVLPLSADPGMEARAGRPEIPRQTIAGTFEGRTESGEEIVFHLGQSGEVVHGVGSDGGYPLVIGGAVTWSAFATLTQHDGAVSAAHMSLSGDGKALTVRRRGVPDLVLHRSESPAAAKQPEGPLSGIYEAHEAGQTAGTASIVQRGDLLYGMADLLGEAAGISARLVKPNRAEGVMTFLDRSQVRFVAEFSDDGDSVVLQGLGVPIDLKRVEGTTP